MSEAKSSFKIHEDMTEAEKLACADRCAYFGDPPCWRLPYMTSDWEEGKIVTACAECRAEAQEASDG